MRHLARTARIARSSAIAVCTAIATAAIAAGSTGPTFASSPAPLGCEPIECAAAYIGVPRSTLAADISNETRRTGTLGTQVAVDQLDTAMAHKLAAIAPAGQLS